MEWWQEDPELLSATLDLLTSTVDEQPPAHGSDAVAAHHATVSGNIPTPVSFMDALSSTPSSADDADDSAAAKMPEKKSRRVINVSRERRRDETRYLRAKVVELEAQLSILQHRREEMLRPHRSETGEIRSVAAVWEVLATRQVQELKRSRQVNDKLKKLVQTQLRVAEDLIAAIRRAEEESRRQCEESDISHSRPRLAIDISRKISEEDQLTRLGVLCTQWREAFASTDKFHDGTSLRFLDVELVQDNGVESVVDVFSSSAAPFAKEKVEEVLWRFYLEELVEEEDGSAFQQDYESRDGDNTIIGVFRALSTIENHRTTFEGKYVSRRVRCPQGHMMIVSHMYSEPRCKSKLLDDVALEEDSWFRVVESHAVGGPKLSHPLTLVQHVRRMRIRFGPSHFEHESGEDQPSPARRRAGALTEFLMLQIQDEMKQGEQCIENMLLDNFNTLSLTSTHSTSDGCSVIV